ncbi:MAG: DNA polymerase III subunit gamma/tau, partial [Patescibacteria group bacterium]
MSSLYRKYRPNQFSELVGQDHIRGSIESMLKSNQIGHAFLFSGPRGTGKTTLARLLARVVNCVGKKKGVEACGECEICLEIQNNQSVDVIEIDAASNRGIDEIRDLREKIAFAPARSKYRVYIIDEVHMLTKEAFNALLKTIEEPPAHAIFILATTELHKVPETIISRCLRYQF